MEKRAARFGVIFANAVTSAQHPVSNRRYLNHRIVAIEFIAGRFTAPSEKPRSRSRMINHAGIPRGYRADNYTRYTLAP